MQHWKGHENNTLSRKSLDCVSDKCGASYYRQFKSAWFEQVRILEANGITQLAAEENPPHVPTICSTMSGRKELSPSCRIHSYSCH